MKINSQNKQEIFVKQLMNCVDNRSKTGRKKGIEFLVALSRRTQETMNIFFGNGNNVEVDEKIEKIFTENEILKIKKLAQEYKFPVIEDITNIFLNGSTEYAQSLLEVAKNDYYVSKWAKNKQIFNFDEDFAETIINSDNLIITKNMFDYLPYDTFFIDLENKEKINELFTNLFLRIADNRTNRKDDKNSEIIGIIFDKKKNTEKGKEYYTLTQLVIYKNSTGTSYKRFISFVDNKDAEIRMIADIDKFSRLKNEEIPYELGCSLQLVAYLCTDKPDICENEEIKAIHRKAVPCKHRASDIQKFEVGVRFGSAVREWKKTEKTKYDESEKTGHHSAHKPHYRRGHWHSYWYKTENGKVKKPKWLAPILVNGNKNTETDYIIHKVEK